MPGFLGTERQFYERFGKPILLSRDAKSSSKEQEAGMWLGVGEGRGNRGGVGMGRDGEGWGGMGKGGEGRDREGEGGGMSGKGGDMRSKCML